MSKKKLIAILTLLCFMFTFMPVAAMASDGDEVATILPEANNGVIKLTGDVKLAEPFVVNAGETVTLDLAGYTISGTDKNTSGNFYLINNTKGNLTITDSSKDKTGKITLTATNERNWTASSVVVANQQGTVTLKAGTIEHLGGTSMAYGIDNLTNGANTVATLNIEGGKVDSTYFAIRQFANNGTNNLNISGGEVAYAWMQSPNANENVANISVTGGKVEGICLSGNNAVVTMNVAADTTGTVYGTAPAGMTIKGSPEEGFTLSERFEAKIGEQNYKTLAEAIEEANSATVTLLEDVELTETVTIPAGKTVTLDLNGYEISGNCNVNQGHLFMIENTAVLNLYDNSIEGTGKITYAGDKSTGWAIDVEGTLNQYSGTIELTGTWGIGYAVDVRPNSWGSEYKQGTVFNMYDGKLVSSDGAVRVASSSSDGGAYPLHKDVSATFNMIDGVIDAAWDGVFVQQSNVAYDVLNLTVNGGEIKAGQYPVRIYGPSPTSYVDENNAITINLNGGSFERTGNDEKTGWLISDVLMLGGGAKVEDLAEAADISITGGSYPADPTAYVVDGYKAVEKFGKYEVVKIVPITGITLNQTTASLKVGNTVTLTATAEPSDTTEDLGDVTWTSADETIATVDANGVVTGVKAGETTITAKAGDFTATCKVTVNKKSSSSSSSSGSSGSSSTTNKTESTTTTTTTTPNGTKVETTTETTKDGTTVETVTTTTASGETSTTVTSTLDNGSSVTNTDEAVNVEVNEVSNSVVNKAEEAVKADANVDVVGDKDNAVNVSATKTSNGATQNTFSEPLNVTVPVTKTDLSNVEDTSKLTLAKVVTNADGTTELVYMGGSYDESTGTFTGKVDEAGDYILVEKDDLVKIELTIDDNTVKTNDKHHELDVAPEINEANRTMLPLRYVGEALGCKVDWNDATRTITISKDGKTFNMTIDQIIPGFGAAPTIKDNRTLVPIRYISEMLGANVIWDPVDRQVIIVQ